MVVCNGFCLPSLFLRKSEKRSRNLELLVIMIFENLVAFLRWEIVLSLAVLSIIYKISKWWLNPLRMIPGPRGSVIFGNLQQHAPPNDAQKVYLKWKKEHGEVFKTWNALGINYFLFHLSYFNLKHFIHYLWPWVLLNIPLFSN